MTTLALAALDTLVRERFAPRERDFHDRAALPLANLQDLHAAGWLRATLSAPQGGASHLRSADPASYLQAVRTVARVSPGTAHCLQVHNHAVWTLDELGTPQQRARFLSPLAERLTLFSFLGSEPGLQLGASAFQTTATREAGGLRVQGRKFYATNGVDHGLGIAFASLAGVDGMAQNHQMVLVEPGMTGVQQEAGWYQPGGMRVAASPQVALDQVFVPDSHVLGAPGAYIAGRWQGRFHLGFTANYLGAAEGVFGWTLDWLRTLPGKLADPFVQAHVGESRVALYAAEAAFERAIDAWRGGDTVQAELASMAAKSICAQSALQVAATMGRLAGSTALFDEYPLARLIRDLQTHILHVGHDRTHQTIGQAALGQSFDSTRQR
jgi:alkylation response protein AidB-like acyl-CoA dehydrogenase